MGEESTELTSVSKEQTPLTSEVTSDKGQVVSKEATGEVSKVPPKTEDIDLKLQEVLKGERSKWQSEKDKELKGLYDELTGLKKRTKEAELISQEKLELRTAEESGHDVTELKDFQSKRRKFLEEQESLQRERQDLDIVKQSIAEDAKRLAAHRLAEQYSVEEKDLLDAKSPQEMETKALKLSLSTTQAKLKEKERPPDKIDSGVPSTSGQDWRGLSFDEKIKRGYAKK